jgi:hypothetical protein
MNSLKRTLGLLVVLQVSGGFAQQQPSEIPGISSFTLPNSESGSRAADAVVAIEQLVLENRLLRDRLTEAERSAAAEKAEAEVFRRKSEELVRRIEALGGATVSEDRVQQRLLQAVNALAESESRVRKLTTALGDLANRALAVSNKPDDKAARQSLQKTLKTIEVTLVEAATGATLGPKSDEPPATLQDGLVGAVQPDIGCIVINLGRRHGADVGMAFQVFRERENVAAIRVVDSRELFSGAIVQSLEAGKQIQVGDRVKVRSQR